MKIALLPTGRTEWLGLPTDLPREHYPKGYLQWLCRASDKRNCTAHDETGNGVVALKELSWQDISDRLPTHFAYLRALIEDLSRCLHCQSAIPHGSPPTSLDTALHDALLATSDRNPAMADTPANPALGPPRQQNSPCPSHHPRHFCYKSQSKSPPLRSTPCPISR